MAGENRYYAPEAASKILQLAGADIAGDERFSTEDLVRAAEEIGVRPASVEQAIQQWSARREESQDRAEFRRRRVLRGFAWVGTFAAYIAVLISLEFHSSRPRADLLAVPILQFSVAMLMVLFESFSRTFEDEKEFQKWRLRRVALLAPEVFQDRATDLVERYVAGSRGVLTFAYITDLIAADLSIKHDGAKSILESCLAARPDLASKVDLTVKEVTLI